jgi:alanyl-tRNA synthetase
MQQFKPYFSGEVVPPSRRVITIQKCVRTGDIDSVGDYSHCTFFEMLGNFSFGDYFKAEVIPWTWEFLTEWLHLDPDRMCVTVYQDDDEAYDIWRKVIGLPEDRIHRLGEDKNYWPASVISEGPDGPCGPCTEIFYRVAPLEEMTGDPNLTPTERYKIDDAAGRWLEIWNNVFTQYNRKTDENGGAVLEPLPGKNNDTGAGFERIATILQGKSSVFETDLFRPILSRIEALAGMPYGGTMEPRDFAFRVLAEHTRSMVFCIADPDPILPSNEGRGSVLRRIIRRAIRYGKRELGFKEPFLHEVAPAVIEVMRGAYPELLARRELALQTIRREEEQYDRTLENGTQQLFKILAAPEVQRAKVLPGGEGGAFTLYATYGFPLELTEEIASEQGIAVDREAFEQAMSEHGAVSGAGGAKTIFTSLGAALAELQRALPPTTFLGYTEMAAEACVAAILRGNEQMDAAPAGEEVEIVLDRTPFYAESGGQIGDTGTLTAPGLTVEVMDTQKAGSLYLHTARVVEGEMRVGQTVQAAIDAERRRHIKRNHTATHLLHAALREALGGHVHQKGSLVAPDRLRFDFTHTQPMTDEEIRRVEERVNALILDDRDVLVHQDIPLEEAKARGAMALFGEKYSDRVRMIEIPGCSLELCGGTHLARTSQAGLCKILSETGIASGVRRIEAVTGAGAYQYINEHEETLDRLARLLKTSPRDVLTAAEKLVQQRAQLEKQLQQLKTGAISTQADLEPKEVAGILVVAARIPNADGATLSALVDRAAQKHRSAVIVLGSATDGKVTFAARVTPDLVQRGFHAGNLLREVAKVTGGGGGGRPDFAQAGGRDASKLPDALAKVEELVRQQAELVNW